jgi:diguanylate cyclase (GGDEF)-like protein
MRSTDKISIRLNRPSVRVSSIAILASVAAAVPFFGYIALTALVPAAAAAALIYFHFYRLAMKTREIGEASRVHLATVEALATAIDARDQMGVGHVRRTQIYAMGIGRALDLNENDIDALCTGALLHDIGKLAIPDHILNKPEHLTTAEMEKTKIHPIIGAAILENIDFNCPVLPTVKYHHERWDGHGYPEGLSGENIPLTARILTVADAFDSMLAARPYRPAMTNEEAKNVLREETGSRFDPRVVKALLENLPALQAEIDTQGFSYSQSDGNHFVEHIKRANREVISLYELAREFSTAADLQGALRMFAGKLGELVPFDTCALHLFDESKQVATAAHVVGNNADMLLSRRIKPGQGATGYTLKTGAPLRNADPDLDFTYSYGELVGEYTAMAAIPLFSDEELIGTVTVYSGQFAEYGEEHIRLLETISQIAADAIGKAMTHDEARANAMTDPMTGLANARGLKNQFDKEVGRSGRTGNSFQLLMLDLDGFKAVNDSFGHKAGDEMLREISVVIKDQLREYDFLARYGGDEFVAIVPDTSPTDVADLCQRIEKAVVGFRLKVSENGLASVGVSIGACGWSGQTFDQCIASADKAMYVRKGKRKGFRRTTPTVSASIRSLIDPLPFRQTSDHLLSDALIVELDETHVISGVQ